MTTLRFHKTIAYWLLPRLFWLRFHKKALAAGLDHLYLILSFDCDADEDVIAAQQIQTRLQQLGSQGIFAVPGTQIEKWASDYLALKKSGAEFINHGHAEHTVWKGGRYWSQTFYDQMTREEVERDIVMGHETLVQTLGITPIGFRAPHFGHYQQPQQLQHVYQTIRSMNYEYSSTTTPMALERLGPIACRDGIWEFPTTGQFRYPLRILDSWGHITDPTKPTLRQEYFTKFTDTVEGLVKLGITGILNYYVDPAHVISNSYFFDAVEYALDRGLVLSSFSKILAKVK